MDQLKQEIRRMIVQKDKELKAFKKISDQEKKVEQAIIQK